MLKIEVVDNKINVISDHNISNKEIIKNDVSMVINLLFQHYKLLLNDDAEKKDLDVIKEIVDVPTEAFEKLITYY